MEIHRDQALAKQAVAGTMTTVVIARGQFDGQVDRVEIFVDADLRPDTRVARVLRRSVFPAVGTELNNLAKILQALGDLAGARPLQERALAITEAVRSARFRAEQ